VVQTNSALRCLPCQDSEERALTVKRMLNVSRDYARELGQSALTAVADGGYVAPSGRRIDWREKIERAKTLKRSIRPDDALPSTLRETFTQTSVQVRNETTMQAAKSFVECGLHPLALNFANGVTAGGGFLHGARAQEEVLCRSSALYAGAGRKVAAVISKRSPPTTAKPWLYRPKTQPSSALLTGGGLGSLRS